MARRRKKTGVTRRRSSRRMGATATKGMLTEVLGVVAGSIIAKKVSSMLTFDDKIKSAIVLGAGVFLPKFVKSPIMKSVGMGMIAVGGSQLAGSFLPMLGATDDYILVSGMDEIPVVNGTEIPVVNGGDDYGDLDLTY